MCIRNLCLATCNRGYRVSCVTDHTDDQAEKIFLDELNAHGQTVKTYKVNLGEEFVVGRISHSASRSAYLKLSIPNLVEEKKVLYVDGDTIFKDCPSKAIGIDLEDNVLGGVCDYSHFPQHRKKWESEIIPFENANEVYINTGLLLWNLKAPENIKLIEKCKELEESYPDKIRFNDKIYSIRYLREEKIINYQFNHQIWNGIIPKRDWERISAPGYKNVNLFHFIGKFKPWKNVVILLLPIIGKRLHHN